MNALISKLSQPSTYAGFAGIATVAGIAAPTFQAYELAAATLFGLIAVVLNEKGATNA